MKDFFNLYSHGFIRAAVCVPEVRVADVSFNAEQTIVLAKAASAKKALFAIFPELGLSAYSNEDLFHQEALLQAGPGSTGPCPGKDKGPQHDPRRGGAAPCRLVSLQRRRRHAPRQDPGCRPEVLPAQLPGILRGQTVPPCRGRPVEDDHTLRATGYSFRAGPALRGGEHPGLHVLH